MPLYVQQAGQQTGPFEDAEVVQLLQEGTLSLDHFAWEYGLVDWMPLGQIREFGKTDVGLPRNPPPFRPPQPPPLLGAVLGPIRPQVAPDPPATDIQHVPAPAPPSSSAPGSPKMSTTSAVMWVIGSLMCCLPSLPFLPSVLSYIWYGDAQARAERASAPAPPLAQRPSIVGRWELEAMRENGSAGGEILSALAKLSGERQTWHFADDGNVTTTDQDGKSEQLGYQLSDNGQTLSLRAKGLAGALWGALAGALEMDAVINFSVRVSGSELWLTDTKSGVVLRLRRIP